MKTICAICLDEIHDDVKLFPFCDTRHILHSHCGEHHINNEIVKKHSHPRCPICRKIMFEIPFVSIFKTRWGFSENKMSVVAFDFSKTDPPLNSFFILGPYPWRGGRTEFSHQQIENFGCIFFVDINEAKSKYKNCLIALYLILTTKDQSLKYSLIGIGRKILDVNSWQLNDLCNLK
jgi:hypothetical protein